LVELGLGIGPKFDGPDASKWFVPGRKTQVKQS